MEKLKYRVGDRVTYRVGRFGNPDLENRVGRVIGIDHTATPYTVEFEEPFGDAAEDLRFGGKKGYCWHCAEEHLSAYENLSESENRKGDAQMENGKAWSEEDDAILRLMKAEGRTAKEIGVRLGRTEGAVNFRWMNMQKTKKKALDAASADTGKSTAELNDLEQVLSERIRELTAENEALKTSVEEWTREAETERAETVTLRERICALETEALQLNEELRDTKEALTRTEDAFDEYRRSGESDALTLNKLQTETLPKYSDLLRKKDDSIERMEEQLRKRTELALGLAEKLLLGAEKCLGWGRMDDESIE